MKSYSDKYYKTLISYYKLQKTYNMIDDAIKNGLDTKKLIRMAFDNNVLSIINRYLTAENLDTLTIEEIKHINESIGLAGHEVLLKGLLIKGDCEWYNYANKNIGKINGVLKSIQVIKELKDYDNVVIDAHKDLIAAKIICKRFRLPLGFDTVRNSNMEEFNKILKKTILMLNEKMKIVVSDLVHSDLIIENHLLYENNNIFLEYLIKPDDEYTGSLANFIN